jgi:hypothetical protein
VTALAAACGRRQYVRVTSILIGIAVFVCTFGGALAGLRLHPRLPEHHTGGDSKDVIKLVMGLVATVAALVLGLLISSAHRAYEAQEAEVQQIGVHLFQLDRALQRFGPEADGARETLRHIVESEVARASAPGGIKVAIDSQLQAQQAAAQLFDRITALSPKTDAQRFVQSRALQLLGTLGDTRLLLNEQAHAAISWPFLVVLVFWLTVLFVGFGLFARHNATVVAALCIGALSVAGAIFLILEMSRAYTGLMQISIAPIQNALIQMKQ